jgi:hypothetical protein
MLSTIALKVAKEIVAIGKNLKENNLEKTKSLEPLKTPSS